MCLEAVHSWTKIMTCLLHPKWEWEIFSISVWCLLMHLKPEINLSGKLTDLALSLSLL